ncbi:histidine kinase [Actomonas aquatica]|uniref:Histidine kinase n=1 Tax=Actomonas aquatica TaxID=2866162 RepID=A0ABZ1C600_9BACT|nr:histidine kinase [Opitutus sp. WL0086]WRQ87162.1 histidine kinase [Opitutus sp. WL0086]
MIPPRLLSAPPLAPRLGWLGLGAVWLGLLLALPLSSVTTAQTLRNAADVLALSPERAAAGLPVTVTGVVTAADPAWHGQFFVQDETAGIYVDARTEPAPAPGTRVEIHGTSHPGDFAPVIGEPQWRVLGPAPLPPARPVSADRLMSGSEDCQRIRIVGTVRQAHLDANQWRLILAVEGYRLTVFIPSLPDATPDSLLGARLQVSGTAATTYHTPVRQLLDVRLHVPRPADVELLSTESAPPWSAAPLPLQAVAQYRPGNTSSNRVHVAGVLTLQRPDGLAFLQDLTGGLRLDPIQPDLPPVGTAVSAIGFIEYDNHLAVLRDAILRPTNSAPQPAPLPAPVAALRQGLHHGERIRLVGHILDASFRPLPATDLIESSWLLQADDLSVTVNLAHAPGQAPNLPVGATVQVDGVCQSSLDASGRLIALHLLLATHADAVVLEPPAWWTPARLFTALGGAALALFLAVAWSLHNARRNALLETKVAERTAQLEVEITGRKADELQFKGALTERTRLARELHDSLEQTLTGIALRLQTATTLAPRDAGAAANHLQTARLLLQQSQVDLRRSIWDLRSRELEQFDLADALRHSAEHLAEAAGLTCNCDCAYPPPRWPEVVEENVLRIGQEALTNIAKHARAASVQLHLHTDATQLVLTVTDDGIGFSPAPTAELGQSGHFGLIGMQERARRIHAILTFEPGPQSRGTRLQLVVPRPTS